MNRGVEHSYADHPNAAGLTSQTRVPTGIAAIHSSHRAPQPPTTARRRDRDDAGHGDLVDARPRIGLGRTPPTTPLTIPRRPTALPGRRPTGAVRRISRGVRTTNPLPSTELTSIDISPIMRPCERFPYWRDDDGFTTCERDSAALLRFQFNIPAYVSR